MPITDADVAALLAHHDDLLSRQETARLLQISPRTVDRMIAKHELPVIRIGSGRGRIRVARADLLDLIARKSA